MALRMSADVTRRDVSVAGNAVLRTQFVCTSTPSTSQDIRVVEQYRVSKVQDVRLLPWQLLVEHRLVSQTFVYADMVVLHRRRLGCVRRCGPCQRAGQGWF